jgi:hypothetical protein
MDVLVLLKHVAGGSRVGKHKRLHRNCLRRFQLMQWKTTNIERFCTNGHYLGRPPPLPFLFREGHVGGRRGNESRRMRILRIVEARSWPLWNNKLFVHETMDAYSHFLNPILWQTFLVGWSDAKMDFVGLNILRRPNSSIKTHTRAEALSTRIPLCDATNMTGNGPSAVV